LNNQRILTTEQLAEFYEASVQQIKQNFNNNKNKFVEGKHYYRLEGNELKDFKNRVENFDLVGKKANSLILYTKQGASRHSKMLGTDRAWDMFDELEENYFNPKTKIDTSDLSPELQLFNGLFQSLAKQELVTKQLETKVDNISNLVKLDTKDWRKNVNLILRKIAVNQGGFDKYKEIGDESYRILETRAKCDLNRRLENRRKNMIVQGAGKSVVKRFNKLDVISEDTRLIEIYVQVVKDMALKYKVNCNELFEEEA